MSRRITEDFIKLNNFFNNYSLHSYATARKQIEECKTMHKKLYGLMIFVAEFNYQTAKSQMLISDFFNEMNSDLLLSLFNWVQGMYKPAKLELRCSIENFLKALLLINTPSVIEEKSVYAIFDLAKADKHFQTDLGRAQIDLLRNDYSILCRTVHSAPLELHSTSALNLLPQYDKVFSEEIITLYTRILEAILGVLYLNYPTIVDNMHPENKKDYLDCLSTTTKSQINTLLYS